MGEQPITRRLVAILAADIAGYSRMMEADEAGTIAAMQRVWSETFNPAVAERHGRVVKMMGDGALVEFGSVVDAVECAASIQRSMGECDVASGRPVAFRIGINLGDIVVDRDDILGDGVNVAARLEGQAPPGGILVSDSVYAQVAGKVGVTFVDAGELKLKNIDRPVRAWCWNAAESAASRSISGFASPLPADKPSIAVLPFAVMGSDPEQEFFADGLVDDITTTLSKLSGLSVIARHSSFVYKGRAVDVRQAARELGVRYVLEGSVRKAAERMRITTQLIDASTGVQIWAERFDRRVEDIFAVQDEITLTLVTEMQVRLTEGDQARLRYTTTTNVEAWSLWIEGLNFDRRPKSRGLPSSGPPLLGEGARARSWLGGAQRLARRHSLLRRAPSAGRGEDRETALRKAEAYVERALSIDPTTPDAHRAASRNPASEICGSTRRRLLRAGRRSSAPTCPTFWSSEVSS